MMKTKNETVIRRAEGEDAATVAELGARTFTAAFGHLYPDQDLAAFLSSTHTPEKVALEIADPNVAVWLAEQAGRAVGYALAGPCSLPHPDAKPEEGELKRIYVEPALQGSGVGKLLFDAALEWLERNGPSRLWIGVWSGNQGAQRFYERAGFRKVGEYQFAVGASRDHEFIMSRA